MEMQEVTKEGERNEDKGASEPMPAGKTEEEGEPYHYSPLQSPSEDIYSDALYEDTLGKTRAGQQTVGNTRLYRAACLFLTIICLVLLLVVIILSVKLQSVSILCPAGEEATAVDRQSPPFSATCSQEDCRALFPNIQPHQPNAKSSDPSLLSYLGCQCANGWQTFGRSCFYLSTFRLSWDESQRNCTARGAALAVVSSQSVQSFLTKEGKMKYWIGLRQKGAAWTWVNNTVLQQSYWAEVTSEGDCGILSSGNPPEKNWIRASCEAYTYFICQLQL